jgi:hypothetical protein
MRKAVDNFFCYVLVFEKMLAEVFFCFYGDQCGYVGL